MRPSREARPAAQPRQPRQSPRSQQRRREQREEPHGHNAREGEGQEVRLQNNGKKKEVAVVEGEGVQDQGFRHQEREARSRGDEDEGLDARCPARWQHCGAPARQRQRQEGRRSVRP